jgi:hypothetical protein
MREPLPARPFPAPDVEGSLLRRKLSMPVLVARPMSFGVVPFFLPVVSGHWPSYHFKKYSAERYAMVRVSDAAAEEGEEEEEEEGEEERMASW